MKTRNYLLLALLSLFVGTGNAFADGREGGRGDGRMKDGGRIFERGPAKGIPPGLQREMNHRVDHRIDRRFDHGHPRSPNNFRNHSHFGIYLGAPWEPWFYPPPVYIPPRVVVVPPPPPPVYIEQSIAPVAPPEAYWYYCREAGAYYPQVAECPNGWLRVAPRP